ncbi:uncharacterized protein LOC126746371 [Anthonomus grandis grandis]|uniref:uncharacterized protein LOC126746371 n=1 Tax=Anthonomus grandis grandis TaxID=2921223 RepID=UPI002166A7F0|nr:uncharacterized protein LOC126746371 [Anthonomus grandis grandis]
MGCRVSKLKKVPKRTLKEGSVIRDEHDETVVEGDGAFSEVDLMEKREEEVIRKDLDETPELFVLNNVLFGTRFLRNYRDDINKVYRQIEKTDDQYWEPDLVMARANRNMIFRPMHGPKKDVAEPLVTRRIYVPMNEFIGVHNPFDDDSPGGLMGNGDSKYQVTIEEGKRDGYVKLQRINVEHEFPNTKDTLSVIQSSHTSGSSDTESTGTWMGTEENRQLVNDQFEEGTLDDCFVFRRNKKADVDLDLEELDHENLNDDDVYDIISYLPPKKFMQYFQSKVFKENIKEQLGLVQYEIDRAQVDKHSPGKIFCNLRDGNGNCYPVEIVPCLKCTWPSRQTYDFTAKHSNGKFRWPTDEMLKELTKLQCALVPSKKLLKGNSISNRPNNRSDLEWEIKFPLAESYLETVLRPEQIKCYLALLTLFKEHLEPYTKGHGVTPEHLLTLILWESEKSYQGWPEHRLGLKLRDIITHISNSLCQRNLKDFFIRNRNLLKNVSRKHLEFANELFHRVKESPLTYFIRALRNIRHTTGSFYPPLDYKALLDILYKTDWQEVNYLTLDDDKSESNQERKPKFRDAEKQLAYVKERERRKKLMKQNEMKSHSGQNGLVSYSVAHAERRGSCDSIDINWECEQKFHKQKKIALLKFFIDHHMDMARVSLKIATLKQTLLYLKQARHLAKILQSETELFPEESLRLLEEIRVEEDKVMATMEENLRKFGHTDAPEIDEKEDEEDEEDVLSGLDDVEGFEEEQEEEEEEKDVYAEVIRQIRQTKINLRALSRQFNSSFIEGD